MVIGGGAAGMMAAIWAAREGASVTLLEQNEKLGKKLYITGKGRCNLTNASDMETVRENVCTNARFLYSAFSGFDNEAVMSFFEGLGLHLKVERGNRVFPQSDHSSDVIAALKKELQRLHVTICLHTRVQSIQCIDSEEIRRVVSVVDYSGKVWNCDAVILATGGLSYPATGSTGDGILMAEALGLRVIPCLPALVPLTIREADAPRLQGLSLRNVCATVKKGKKVYFEQFGELLFTHFGVSGPLMLSASSVIAKQLQKGGLTLLLDLKPALTREQLQARLLREFTEHANQQMKHVAAALFPSKLIPVMLERSGISPHKRANEVTKEERNRLVDVTKALSFTITGTREFSEAIITQGGVSVKEVDPSTMESKKVKGLYLAGELLDVDAHTGGYNLQIAWSTGYAAGKSAVKEK